MTEWERTHDAPTKLRVFRKEILPHLQHVRVVDIARATGLSQPYASEIRKGRIPHPRHWATLRALVSGTA